MTTTTVTTTTETTVITLGSLETIAAGTGIAVVPAGQEPDTRAPSMSERIESELDANPLGHEWVTQATISIDRKTAKRAAFRGSFRSEEGMRIDALEVMCHVCRRTYDAVAAMDAREIERVAVLNEGRDPDERVKADLDCPGQIDNSHLIGGDLSVRAKRIIHEPVGVIRHHVIDRRGMAGYSVHAGT